MAVDFDAKQREFAAHIRDPGRHPPPADVPAPRMALYRELFLNNINNFLASNFPVLRAILDDGQWHGLTGDFFARHRSASPYFSDIPEEFIDFLSHERAHAGDPPFLLELAHYEWVEMAVAIANEELVANTPPVAVAADDRIRLSPLAWPLAYQYPVQQIAPGFMPAQPPAQPTFLVVYRDVGHAVHFCAITALTYRLLSTLDPARPQPVAHCLEPLLAEAPPGQRAGLSAAALSLLTDLAQKNIVLLGGDGG